jgi:nucleoside-diphosphate-sugar epimerase
MSMSVLVTGGAGYIGSVLVPALLKVGYRVTVLDNFLYGQDTLLECCQYEGFQIVRGDSRDPDVIRPLAQRADIIIPLAALVGAPICERRRSDATSVNLEAVKMLVSISSQQQRFIFPTTNSGYGIGEQGKFCTENTPLRPISLYGVTKVEAEKIILERENSISFRLATVFGISPRMRLDLLVNDFVCRAVNDHAILIFEGHFKRNYIHVQDVAKVFLHAIQRFDAMKGCPYNVGLEDANLSKLELCAEIRKELPNFVYVEAPIGEDPDKRDYIVSNARILATDFLPEWTLQRGIRELIKGFTILRNGAYTNV